MHKHRDFDDENHDLCLALNGAVAILEPPASFAHPPASSFVEQDARLANAEPLPEARPSSTRSVLPFVATGVALLLLVDVLRRADWARVGALLGEAGPQVLWCLVPYALAMAANTVSWSNTLAQLGFVVPFVPLFRLRLGAEAVVMSLPGGAVINEGLKPWWLRQRLSVGLAEGTASVALQKAFILAAEGLFLLLALALGSESVRAIFAALGLGSSGWLWHLLLGLAMCFAGVGMLALFRGGALTQRIVALCERVPIAVLQRSLARMSAAVGSTDRSLRGFFRKGGLIATITALVLGLAHWTFDAVETYLILRVLGIGAGFDQALVIEALASTIRAVAFFVPAGVGVQDISIVFMLKALGVGDPINAGSAVVVTKRLKEVFWIVAGYSLLLARKGRDGKRGS